MKKHSIPVHDGLSESVPTHCAAARHKFAMLAEILGGLVDKHRPASGRIRQKPEFVDSGSFVPAPLRSAVPELETFLRALDELNPVSGENPGLRRATPIPADIVAVLTFSEDFHRMRQAAALTGKPDEVFEAFASLRRRPEDKSMALPMKALSRLIDEWETADASFRETVRCCAALLSQMWQSHLLFPAGAEALAAVLLANATASRSAGTKRKASSAPVDRPTTESVGLLARLLFSGGVNGESDRCGFIPWRAKDTDVLYEEAFALRHEGKSLSLTAQADAKCEEYTVLLARSRFAEEWDALKHHFPKITAGKRCFARTAIPDVESEPEAMIPVDDEPCRFQALLDLLCWKYCLTGIRDDQPLLMKPSVRVTPYGTQISIPAYMSLDLERDFHLPALKRMHKTRGVRRQGEGMSRGREEMLAKCIEAAEADEDARRSWGTNGGKRYAGETRMTYLKDYLKMSRETDDAQILRMIARGKTAMAEATRRQQLKGK